MTIKSLLPLHFTPLEHALDKASGERFALIDIDMSTFWNADTCPAYLLPLLAASTSVDVFDYTWSEKTQREVIKQSPELHNIKGTPAAVKKALKALGLNVVYKEWHQYNPPRTRGTFTLEIALTEAQVINPNVLNSVYQMVSLNKRGSQHIDQLYMKAQGGTQAAIGGEIEACAIVRVSANVGVAI